MVTLTRATLEDNGPIYIRDVLRNHLSDPLTGASARSSTSAWIVKGAVKNEAISFPMVVLDKWEVEESTETLDGSAIKIVCTLGFMVWGTKTDAMKHRDQITEQIKVILQDTKNKTDGTTTMHRSGLGYISSSTRVEDGYIKGFSELIRIKSTDVKFIYMR